ncbi:MutS protein-like protein 1 [Erysiphe neolycopersici]|uniref:MutS protein-like protein 1 n=1 Tax=Erysiphe neolycopersici TaxID=212602 RepID=A0A420I847_9PEZI|nr:MutS protein-like protein 1 [Erysiphe neolycopersici]
MQILIPKLRVKTPIRLFLSFSGGQTSVSQVQTRAASFLQSSSVPKKKSTKKGKKSVASINLDSLPQGIIQLEPLSLDEDVPSYPKVVQQARTNMQNFENCVLLTRVGGFYEIYFEQAEEIGPLLGLKVATKKTNAGPVSMAGFPFFQLDRYLKILVQDFSRNVAIAEEFANDTVGKLKAGGLLHDRRVTRVITKGTLIDEDFMDPFTNSYITAIHIGETLHKTPEAQELISDKLRSTLVGLAWLDLSTGHFFTQSTNLPALPSVLARISPREIVLDERLKLIKNHEIFNILAGDSSYLISYTKDPEIKQISQWAFMLESPVPSRSIKNFTHEEVSAGSILLQYVENRVQGSDFKLQTPVRQLDLMAIDRNTIKALEIRTTLSDSIVGSLLHTIRHTVTKGGARLLDRWLGSPSTSLDVINSRLDLVEYLIENESLRKKIRLLLNKIHDSHRIVQKFAFGRGNADDLLALASTIDTTQELLDTLKTCFDKYPVNSMILRIKIDGPKALAKRIKAAIDEEGVLIEQRRIEEDTRKMRAMAEAVLIAEDSNEELHEGDTLSGDILPKTTVKRRKKITSIRENYCDNGGAWIMKPAASPILKTLHDEFSQLSIERDELEKDLCERLGAASLTLRFTPGLGHICHVRGKDINISVQNARSVGSSKSTRSFHFPEWTKLGLKIEQCISRMRAEEQVVFQALRELVAKNIAKLRRNAAVLDELDVACSSAVLAIEKNWSRPILNLGTRHKIISGRHPTVERGLENEGRSFITNDCFVGDIYRTWLITGPNMGGKSTFLRQNALITILAQVGSYVPASYAEIGIVDQIFSRIGSADNLYRDQSTFMLEMLETAQILKQASSKSFVIMDEIGRGTTPEDGEAVAWACLWHLTCINKSRTLFATHFHGLTDRTHREGLKTIGLWCTDIEEGEGEISNMNGSFRYVHKLREGVNRRSHALKVARLAGVPEEVIHLAQKLLEEKGSA